MITVIGSSRDAERLERAIAARGVECLRVPSREGSSAEERFRAARAALSPVRDTALLAVAATGEDERSLVTAAWARRLGARPVVAVVESLSLAMQSALAEAIGVDRVIEPDVEAAAAAVEHIIGPVAAAVHSLGQGHIRTAELVIPRGSVAVGRPLREQGLPRGARVALVRRAGENALAPTAATVLEADDRVLLVSNRVVAAEASAIFGAAPQAGPRVLFACGRGVLPERQERFARLLAEADLDVEASAVGSPPNRSAVLVAMEPDANLLEWSRDAGFARVVIVQGDDDPEPARRNAVLVDPIDAVGRAVAAMRPRPAVERVGSLAPGVLDVYRVRAGDSGEWLGGPLRQTPGIRGWIVLATQSGAHAHLPHPEDAIEPGDVLIVAGPPGAERTLERAVGQADARAVA